MAGVQRLLSALEVDGVPSTQRVEGVQRMLAAMDTDAHEADRRRRAQYDVVLRSFAQQAPGVWHSVATKRGAVVHTGGSAAYDPEAGVEATGMTRLATAAAECAAIAGGKQAAERGRARF